MRPLFLLAVLLLAACSGGSGAPSEELDIALSPAAQPVQAALLACLPQDGSVTASVETLYPSQVELAEYDFYIQLGTPDERPALVAKIASEQVVLVTHRSQGLSSLGAAQAAELLSGRAESWEQLGGQEAAVLLFVPPHGDEARRALESSLLRAPISGQALIAIGPQTLLDNVAANSGAAGILPAAWADESVRAHDLGISLPVLALAAETPQGAARGVLACLQSSAGQAILGENYAP